MYVFTRLLQLLYRDPLGAELRFRAFLARAHSPACVATGSYLLWSAFHGPTWLYTFLHTELGKISGTPVASEVYDGWYIGGVYSYELKEAWAGVLDLTVEFPENCIGQTMAYKLVPVWDGTPPTPQQLEEAAEFCVAARARGKVLVHCAHGRGRSTCCMVAALTKAGAFATWEDAFDACKKKRPVVKLNSKMRRALKAWAEDYQKKQE
eukprot:scaffold2850_cov235-Pinguiococcus_pyrenoidosus.AAC.15